MNIKSQLKKLEAIQQQLYDESSSISYKCALFMEQATDQDKECLPLNLKYGLLQQKRNTILNAALKIDDVLTVLRSSTK